MLETNPTLRWNTMFTDERMAHALDRTIGFTVNCFPSKQTLPNEAREVRNLLRYGSGLEIKGDTLDYTTHTNSLNL